MSDITTASLVLSTIVALVAALLGWREWTDRRSRDPDPSPEDARHYRHQDARRALGIVVMIALAVGLVVGSRLPPRLVNKANTAFLAVWMGVFVMILLLLWLALIDWVALRIFARRHRNQILRERVEILRDEARRKAARPQDANGTHHEEGPLRDLLGDDS